MYIPAKMGGGGLSNVYVDNLYKNKVISFVFPLKYIITGDELIFKVAPHTEIYYPFHFHTSKG